MTTEMQGRPTFLILMLAAGFIVIITISVIQRIIHPSLTIQTLQSGSAAMSQTMPSAEMDTIGTLMNSVAKNPNDQAVLLELVERLMTIGQWEAAENFAQKALANNPENTNTRLLYLLALTHHNKNEHAQAAELLEKLLSKEENPSARYSLGVLYLHYLDKPQQGMDEFKKGLAIPNLSQALRHAIQDELTKAENINSAPMANEPKESDDKKIITPSN